MAVRLVLRNILLRERSLLNIQQPHFVTPLFSGNFQNVPNEGHKRYFSRIKKKDHKLASSLYQSGDTVNRIPLPNDTIKFWCRDIKEIETAPEHVKQLLTIEYANHTEIRDHEHHVLLEKIEETLGPDCVLEKKIAYCTLRIRAVKKHLMSYRRDKVSKSILSEKIAKRRKMLKQLKKRNIVNFRWLTGELRIIYKPLSKYIYWPLSNKGKRKKRVSKKAFSMKIEKIEKLREKYRKEKDKFDVYKAETLSQIEKDLKDLNLTIADVYDPTALAKKERVKKEKVQFKGRIWY